MQLIWFQPVYRLAEVFSSHTHTHTLTFPVFSQSVSLVLCIHRTGLGFITLYWTMLVLLKHHKDEFHGWEGSRTDQLCCTFTVQLYTNYFTPVFSLASFLLSFHSSFLPFFLPSLFSHLFTSFILLFLPSILLVFLTFFWASLHSSFWTIFFLTFFLYYFLSSLCLFFLPSF